MLCLQLLEEWQAKKVEVCHSFPLYMSNRMSSCLQGDPQMIIEGDWGRRLSVVPKVGEEDEN